jgi:hypothetical protein
MDRPFPPAELFDTLDSVYLPAPELTAWAKAMFIDDDALMQSGEHEHLQQAGIGFLWTNEQNERRGRMILGTCQMLPPSGDKWSVGRATAQLRGWFGEMPDFLIMIYAPAALVMDDASFSALVFHELMHAGQRRDQYGAPMFSKDTGAPLWAMRGHDIEQFVSVVRMFGARAAGVEEMVEAANRPPMFSEAEIEIACGTCRK